MGEEMPQEPLQQFEHELAAYNNHKKAIHAFGFYHNHVVRAPIVRILGLINLALLEENSTKEEMKEILMKIKECAQELDDKTKNHNTKILVDWKSK